jgi:hypothetical protein
LKPGRTDSDRDAKFFGPDAPGDDLAGQQRSQVILGRVGRFAIAAEGRRLVDLDPIRAKPDRAGDRVVGGRRSPEDDLAVGRVVRNRSAVGSDDAAQMARRAGGRSCHGNLLLSP